MKKAVTFLFLSVLFLTGIISNTYADIPTIEREALIALYNSTDGDNWTDNSGWKDGDIFSLPGTECNWEGVTCDYYDHVVRLNLAFHELTGQLPPELGNLVNLTHLILTNNELIGSIPPELGNLSNLTYLDFFDNQLNGQIPPELGNLSNLTSLVLDTNQLTGPIPSELGNLSNLIQLYLGNNPLSCSIPTELGNLSNLTSLGLSNNQLTGSIPIELVNLTNLEALRLDQNQLSGSIPPEIGNLSFLKWLSLRFNNFTDPIPPEIGNLTSLSRLELGSTQISGSIPSEIGNLTNLSHLELGSTQISGSIPPELGNLNNLTRLIISSNQLSGEIPIELQSLTGLTACNIGYNALFTDNEDLVLFLNDKDSDWEETQTIAPDNITINNITPYSATVNWTPIFYTSDNGGYIVSYSTTSGGPYTEFGTTADKSASQMEIAGLAPEADYYFVVQAKTESHTSNQNTVISDYSIEVSAQTESDVDTDEDGLIDFLENTMCTEFDNSDTDGDGILDGIEDVNQNGTVDAGETNPCDNDSDDDSILDGDEDLNQNGIVDEGETDPTNSDSDGDGMPDGWEINYGLDPLINDAADDFDGDGISNVQEFLDGTAPDFNPLPVLDEILEQTVDANSSLVIDILAANPDSIISDITLSVAGLPDFCIFTDNGDGTGEIIANPPEDVAPYYYIKVIAENDKGFTEQSFRLNIFGTDGSTLFIEYFETGAPDWSIDNGVWEVGEPTSGPENAYEGTSVAGTILDGNYPYHIDSRLISPSVTLPTVSGNEEIHLKFWHWFHYYPYGHNYSNDYGRVQISTDDGQSWTTISQRDIVDYSTVWTLYSIDLTAYAGQEVRIAFFHSEDPDHLAPGWYIDNVTIEHYEPEFGDGTFEDGWGGWSADRGVWQIGVPTSGPGSAYEGISVAGTILDGEYPYYTDSRLISPSVTLPTVSGNEEIHLKFWHWFHYYPYGHNYSNDYGRVQISTDDGQSWTTISQRDIVDYSTVWTLCSIDLTAYAGQEVRIAFFHSEDPDHLAPGWYIDNVTIEHYEPEFGDGTFEDGWGGWSADRGVWQIGVPTSGPGSAYEGTSVAGTILDGDYPYYTDSRLISPSVTLPTVSGNEEIHLKFWHWFHYYPYGHNYSNDYGRVQISTDDGQSWTTISQRDIVDYSTVWTLCSIDLTAYAGQEVRIAFFHSEDPDHLAPGWYIDNVTIEHYEPEFGDGTFEDGWGGWSADRGVWQIGVPTSGPGSAYEGISVAGTILDGEYPYYTDSRLISPSVTLPTVSGNEEIHLKFWHWFHYYPYGHNYSNDYGRVQISTDDGQSWTTISQRDIVDYSTVWTLCSIDLTAYAGQEVRIAFFHSEDPDHLAPGWYIDNVTIEHYEPEFGDGTFEDGWGGWSADRGVWQIGVPTSGPGSAYEGTSVAGTILDGDYPYYTDSRLISPSVILPTVSGDEEIHLKFWHWFHYYPYGHNYSYDYGRVQISTDNGQTWIDIGELVTNSSGDWLSSSVDLTTYAGQKVKIAFYHREDPDHLAPGWYIDNVYITLTHTTPSLTQIFDQNMEEGTALAILITATDLDGDMITLSTSGIPAFCSFIDNGDGTGSIACDPGYGDAGVYDISVTASDGEHSDTEEFVLTVVDVFRAPVVSDIGDQLISEGAFFVTINLDDYVTDEDTSDEEISWSYSGNSKLSVFINARIATISAPNTDWNGSETITFRATDPQSLYAEDTATFTVTAVNDAPVVGNIPGQSINSGSSFTPINLDNYVSDVDNSDEEMTWTISGNSALAVSIVDRVASITAPADWKGSETITFRVSDPESLYAEVAATFTVANQAPVLAEIADQTVYEGGTLILTITASDPDGDSVSFNADLPSFADFEDNGDGTATLTISPGTGDEGDYSASITVSDSTLPASTDTDNFMIYVNRLSISADTDTIDFSDVVIGESADQTFNITNIGADPITIIDIYSSDVAFTPGFSDEFIIEPGASKLISINFEPLTENAYTGVITVVSTEGASNILSVSGSGITVEGEPLNVPSPLEYTLVENSTADKVISIINPGTETRTADVEIINPYEDLIFTLAGNTINIASGETGDIQIEINSNTAVPGTYEGILLKLTVDNGNIIYSDITVNVTKESLPDLSISAEDIKLLTYNDVNGTITISAEVYNKGTLPASNVAVSFYQFGTLFDEVIITGIPEESSEIVTVTLDVSGASGERLIQVAVDPDDEIVESNEYNNQATQVVQFGPAVPAEGNILVTGNMPSQVYTNANFNIFGNAVYDIYVDGIRYTDYEVKGGLVSITVSDSSGNNEWTYSGFHTDMNGDFLKLLQAPSTPGNYQVVVSVTDNTFIGRLYLVLRVVDSPSDPYNPPSYLPSPPSSGGGSGGSSGGGSWSLPSGGSGGSGGEYVWLPTNPDDPVPENDLYIYSEHIHFTNNNPDPGEEITIFAEVNFWAPSTLTLAENIPVNIYATYPGEAKTKIAETIINQITVGAPNYGTYYVYTTWQNDREGIYIIEVEIDPSYIESNMMNNAATRAIIVGDLGGDYGAVEGNVYDQFGGVSGVIIELIDPAGISQTQQVLTDATGYYIFPMVVAGDYQVHIVTPDGYQADAETKPAVVIDQEITTVDFYLSEFTQVLEPPVADAGGPYTGECGGEILLDAGDSDDPDGEIVLYEWDFDNDGIFDADSSASEFYYIWDDEFSGTVTLRVTDNDGLTSTDTAEVEITCEVADICGDLDDDGDVDADDMNILRLALRTTPDDLGFVPEADYDMDDDIDFYDYQIWYACYKDFLYN